MNPPLTRRAAMQSAGAALVAGPSERGSAASPARLRLRLIGTSDLHANIFAYDYYRDKPDDTVGLAKTAALIRAARAEAPNVLLFDNGDIIQGTPLGDYCALSAGMKEGEVHPMIAAMNVLGYAAATVGNHEFNYGLDFLERALAGANFPILCCNVFKPDGSPYFTTWQLIEWFVRDEAGAGRKIRIGVIGFTPPQIVQWDMSHLAGRATTAGIAETARTEIPKLRAEGVDLVVALCHSGIARKGPPQPGEENAALALSEVPGIDVIVLGHQHLLLPGADFAGVGGVDVDKGALNGVPAFMPGFWGSHLGVIDLDLELKSAGWRIAGAKVEARPIYARAQNGVTPLVAAEPDVLAAAQKAHDETLAYARAPVGDIASPINSYFALIADDPSVQIVNAAQLWYAKNLIAAMPALAGLPILSAAAPFKSGGRGGPDYYTDVKAGAIALKNVADIYLYPNTIRIVKVSGAIVREWLERSAGTFLRIDPAETKEQPLLGTAFASYNFDVIDGVTYEIDVTQASRYDEDGKLIAPNAHRIRDLKFDGAPIDEAKEFLVVTNNYRASGGGNFPGCDGSTVVLEAPDANRDALLRYIVETKHVEPKADYNWRFKPWPGNVVATFLTSPAAAAVTPPRGVKLTAMGEAAGGFVKYRVEPL
ncbi:MAG TPA: bifunctional 2',3'-cyclic-nucleotide 2'-phosphodiesterase/3'-nucleotidase [Roseiarcus sp.]|nr:bifunctional 2',3'-cyclic-nucleotide 2'-phosphodiesterase/3'-nucleotidase [Roseiarcus sp.]